MQIFLGVLNIALGFIFLLIPIIFIELGRSKDLIKSFLLLILGISLVISPNSFRSQNLLILIITSLIITFLVFEIFKNRWEQLSEKEKTEFRSFSSINSKLLVFFNALKLTFEKIYLNIFKVKLFGNNKTSKKWVRSENHNKNDNVEKIKFNSLSTDFDSTNNPKTDIIKDEKI